MFWMRTSGSSTEDCFWTWPGLQKWGSCESKFCSPKYCAKLWLPSKVLLDQVQLRWVRVEADGERKWSRVDVYDRVCRLLVALNRIGAHRVRWLDGRIHWMATVVAAAIGVGRGQGKSREKDESLCDWDWVNPMKVSLEKTWCAFCLVLRSYREHCCCVEVVLENAVAAA